MNVKENVFSSEREFKKAFRDIQVQAQFICEQRGMNSLANCGKI